MEIKRIVFGLLISSLVRMFTGASSANQNPKVVGIERTDLGGDLKLSWNVSDVEKLSRIEMHINDTFPVIQWQNSSLGCTVPPDNDMGRHINGICESSIKNFSSFRDGVLKLIIKNISNVFNFSLIRVNFDFHGLATPHVADRLIIIDTPDSKVTQGSTVLPSSTVSPDSKVTPSSTVSPGSTISPGSTVSPISIVSPPSSSHPCPCPLLTVPSWAIGLFVLLGMLVLALVLCCLYLPYKLKSRPKKDTDVEATGPIQKGQQKKIDSPTGTTSGVKLRKRKSNGSSKPQIRHTYPPMSKKKS